MEEIALRRVISGTREVTLDALVERAACAATGLGEIGVGKGDAVAVVLRNDFAFFEASFAAQRLGAYCVPVNWHGKTPEFAYVLNDCGAVVYGVTDKKRIPERVPTLCFNLPNMSPGTVTEGLVKRNIGVRDGHMYSPRLMKRLGLAHESGAVRASLVHYNTVEEVRRFGSALAEIASN